MFNHVIKISCLFYENFNCIPNENLKVPTLLIENNRFQFSL